MTKDQDLNRKMEEVLSMMKDMADKTNLCTSDPPLPRDAFLSEGEGK